MHLSTFRDSQCSRWTDGDSLRLRVDNIANTIAKEIRSSEGTQFPGETRFHGGTRFLQEEEEEAEEEEEEGEGGEATAKKNKDDGVANESRHDRPAASTVSHQAVIDSSTDKLRRQITPEGAPVVDSEACLPPTPASDAGTHKNGRSVGLVDALGATNDTTTGQLTARARTSICAAGDNHMEQPDEHKGNHPDGIGVGDTSGLCSTDGARLTGGTEIPQSVRIDPSPTAGDARNGKSIAVGEAKAPDVAESPTLASTSTDGSPNHTTTCNGHSRARASRRRSRARPASASGRVSGNSLSSSSCLGGVRRSLSSPGLTQGSHHSGQSLADIADIAEAWEYLDGRDSRVLHGKANVLGAEDDVGMVDFDAAAVNATTSNQPCRGACGDGANDATFSAHGGVKAGEGQEIDNGCNSISKVGAELRKSGELGRDSRAYAGIGAAPRSRNPSPPAGTEPNDAAALRAGSVSKPQLSARIASAAVPAKVETPLEFQKATVKLKVSGTAWGTSQIGQTARLEACMSIPITPEHQGTLSLPPLCRVPNGDTANKHFRHASAG